MYVYTRVKSMQNTRDNAMGKNKGKLKATRVYQLSNISNYQLVDARYAGRMRALVQPSINQSVSSAGRRGGAVVRGNGGSVGNACEPISR